MILIRLKELRVSKQLTKLEVATKINKSFQAYSHYETGKRQPDYETLKKLADLFEVSIDYLLGYDKPTSSNLDIEITPEDLELLRQIKKAPPEKRKAIEIILNSTEQNVAADK